MNIIHVNNIIDRVLDEHFEIDDLRKFILRDFVATKDGTTAPFRELTEDQAEVVMKARKKLSVFLKPTKPTVEVARTYKSLVR